jgi:apolipoprotein N-acyltransferase
VIVAAALAAAIGAWFGFANPLYHFPVLVLALPAALAVCAGNSDSPRAAFKNCWFAGFSAYALSMYWVAIPVHDYGGLPWILAIPCPALLGLYMGLYPAVFGFVLRLAKGMSWPLYGILAACLWAALELVRGVLFTGFPWLVLASAFSPWPEAIQSASLIGAYGLSGLLAGTAVLLTRGRLLSAPRVAGLCILALVAVYGTWQLSKPVEHAGTLSVSLVQGNIDQTLKWDETFQEGTVERYTSMSRGEIENNAPGLIVWPETAMPFYFQEPSVLSGRVRAFARDNDVLVLTGSPAYRPDYKNQRMVLYNRAYLVGPGGIAGYYDKEHLVPFGEYVPLENVLFFLDKLVQGVGDFEAGKDQKPLTADGFNAGVLICYETIFPELAQARVASGADLLLNISNDAWFGRSSAPLQHLHLSALRAVEQRRSIARATNTGVSAFIDPRGRISRTTPLFHPATVNEPELMLVTDTTFFHRHRDAVTVAYCLGAALITLLSAWRFVSGRNRP